MSHERPGIERLRPEVVAKIAAGEMILRPLSVAKELLENSLDAGSRRIEVDIREAADRYLSVRDDGCGMSSADCRLALERHATSKLRDEADLFDVATLGFRGEALPSIARVARLRIVTADGSGEGTELRAHGGSIDDVRPAARGRGTTIEVEDLFFNTPVRKRFLRSPAAETRLVNRLICAYGLAFPDVAFVLRVDAKVSLDLPQASAEDRLEQVYGSGFLSKVLPLEGDHPRLRIRGWVGIPEIARATASSQTLFVGRRWVSHPALAAALRQGFGDLLPPARQPFAVLMLDPARGTVDVNIHPTKREIRFADDALVFSEVARTVRGAARRLVPGIAATEAGWASTASRDENLRLAPETVREDFPLFGETSRGLAARTITGDPVPRGDAPGIESRGAAGDAPPVPIWQVQNRYIVAPIRQGILIVDQHAAHERILYERALRWLGGEEAASQQLLFPVLVHLRPEEVSQLRAMTEDLARLGIHVEIFGADAVMLRAAPATWEGDLGTMLRDVVDDFTQRTRAREARISALAASFACHSAIRSGTRLDVPSMNALIDELFATGLPHGDPHGRPTYVILGTDDLDRRFGRT